MKELKFIHITKTGGSSIEDCAYKNKILFGRHHKEYQGWHKFFSEKSLNLKLKYDWFMVVRNPYDRVLSEYYCRWGGIGTFDIKHTKDEMNKFLIHQIRNRKPVGDHYSEQFKYLDKNPEVKIHVLKFENLKEEFDNLMKEYNLDLTLNVHLNKSKPKVFSINDFSKELINLINDVYSKDFEIFNYTKI